MRSPSHEHQLHIYDSSGEEQQTQDGWQRELSRIYAYIEPRLAPDDRALVLRAFGLDEQSRKQMWLEMACAGDN